MTTSDISRIVAEMRFHADRCDSHANYSWGTILREYADRLEAIAQQPSNAVPDEVASSERWELAPKEERMVGCRHEWENMTHKPDFDYCKLCGTSRYMPRGAK